MYEICGEESHFSLALALSLFLFDDHEHYLVERLHAGSSGERELKKAFYENINARTRYLRKIHNFTRSEKTAIRQHAPVILRVLVSCNGKNEWLLSIVVRLSFLRF